jgi:predicted PurR-regulated permease PerM
MEVRMNNITISAQALGWIIIILILLVVGIFLVIALIKLIALINRINKLVNENEEKLKTTMKNVAEITDNANKMSLSLKDVTTGVSEGVGEFTSGIKSSRSFADSASIASNIILTIMRFLKKK